jgi:LuxR family maltose regulon positive regulatory protein
VVVGTTRVHIAPTEPSSDVDGLLIDAKVRIPETSTPSVTRADLIERVRSSGCRVVGITAPAGYGKSTLLVEWARSEDRGVAWVSFDRYDDDPARVVGLLAHAYGRLGPEHADRTLPALNARASPLARAAPLLAAAFRASSTPFVLMLDDLHELRSPECQDVLRVIIDGTPQGSQFVAASRFELAHLARARAEGDGLELGMSDLALDAVGARAIFSAADVPLSHELAVEVAERTEGWPVGLHLAAVIAREGDDRLTTLDGSERYVADYLYQEALRAQPDDVQKFLRRTAILEELSGPLCDAVAGTDDGGERLRRQEISGLFMVPLDRRREWYRYHGLFRDFLLSELRRTEPGVIEALHVRAADWYELNGSSTRGVEHLLLTGSRDHAARSVARACIPAYYAGEQWTSMRWMSTLGDDAIESYPPLAVSAGWGGVLTGDPAAAERWAAFIDTTEFDEVPVDGSASFASNRAQLRAAMCPNGPEAMAEDAVFAVEQEPVWSAYRSSALWLAAEAQELIGNVDDACTIYGEASRVARRNRNTDNVVVAESELALLRMDQHDWKDAAVRVGVAQASIEEHGLHDYAVSSLTFLAAARLALHRGDSDTTQRQMTLAMRARAMTTYVLPFVAVRLRLGLAGLQNTLGDVAAARHLLREVDEVLQHRPALGTLVDQTERLRRALAAAPRSEIGPSPLTPAELRILPYLQTHLTLAGIAERLYLSRNTVSSHVSAIYRKLGVVSRPDAVERATAIGLLDDYER